MLIILGGALASAAQAHAQGQPQTLPATPTPASVQPTSPGPDNAVSGVTVVAHRATRVAGVTVSANACPEPDPTRFAADPSPSIVDTYPAPDSVVAPGALVLRASFAAPMSCYWEVTSESESEADPCQDAGSWILPGRTSWIMTCTLKPGAHYKIRFGQGDGEGDGQRFVGRSGRAAPSYVLNFTTSSEPPISAAEARRLSLETLKEPPALAYVTCSAKPDNKGADCIRIPAGLAP